MVIPIGVCAPTGCEEASHPVQGAVFMGFVVPVVRAERRARTTGYCPFTPPAWQKRPNSSARSQTAPTVASLTYPAADVLPRVMARRHALRRFEGIINLEIIAGLFIEVKHGDGIPRLRIIR